jgi:site-specific DNA-methyltransferase (adenine-specific)
MALRFMKELQGTRDSDNYATPIKFYSRLNNEFQFDYDPCPLRSEIDGLKTEWNGAIYCNPPYSNIEPFIKKGLSEMLLFNARVIVYLIPVRSDTKYWHELIMKHADEIRFVKGRLNFNESKSPAPFPVCLVVFRLQGNTGLKIKTYSQ